MGFRGFRDPQSNLFIGPNGFRVPWDLVQIYVQVHEISGSPGTSFKLICGPMGYQGPLGPPSQLYASPWGCKVPWDLFQHYLQAHEISGARGTSFTFICSPFSFRGLLDPPSNWCGVHEVSLSPRPSVKVMYGSMGLAVSATLNQIYLQAHSDSGSPGTSIKFIYRSMTFQGPLGPPSNWYAGPWDIRVP